MAGQDDVLIKIASDVSGALAGLNTLSGVMVKFAEDMKKAGEAAVQSGAKAVGFGELYAKAWERFEDAAKGALTSIPNIIKSSADAADSLRGLSLRTDVSVQSLSAFQYVADQTGVSFQLLSRSIQTFGIQIQEGSDKTRKSLEGLGLSLDKLQQEKPEDAFIEVLKGLKEIPDAAERTAKGVELLGPKFRMMSNLATEDVDALVQKAKELGLTIDDKFAEKSNNFNAALGTIHAQMQATKDSITNFLIGPLTDVLKLSEHVPGSMLLLGDGVFEFGKKMTPVVSALLPMYLNQIKGVNDIVPVATKLFKDFGVATTAAVGKVTDVLKNLGTTLPALLKGIEALTAATLKWFAALLTNPLFLATAAIVAMGVALYAAEKHWESIGDTAEESAKKMVKAGQDAALQAQILAKEKELADAKAKDDAARAAAGRSGAMGYIPESGEVKRLTLELEGLKAGSKAAHDELDKLVKPTKDQTEAQRKLGEAANYQLEQIEKADQGYRNRLSLAVRNANVDADQFKKDFGVSLDIAKKWDAIDQQRANAQGQAQRDREALGTTGTSAQLKAIEAARSQAIEQANQATVSSEGERQAMRDRANQKAESDRAKLSVDTARQTAATTRQIETDRRTEEINENKKGLDAQLAMIEVRRAAAIEDAKKSGDAASVLAKTNEANQRAALDADKAKYASEKQLADAAEAQKADFAMRDIAMQEEGAAKETATIEAKYQRQLQVIAKNETDVDVIEAQTNAAKAERDKEQEELRVKQAKSAAETILENARTYREQQIKDTEVGEQQLRDLREVDLEREIAGWKKAGASKVEIDEKVRAYRAETERQIAQGNTETTNGLITRAKQYRKEYENAIKNVNLTDAQRLVLLKKVINAEQEARHEQAHDNEEILRQELANATAARVAMDQNAEATFQQREKARREEFDAMLALEKNAKRRAEMEVAYNKALLLRMKLSGDVTAAEIANIEAVIAANEEAAGSTIHWTNNITALAGVAEKLGSVFGGTFGEVTKSLSGMTSGLGEASKAMEKIQSDGPGGGLNVQNLSSLAAGWVGVAVAIYQMATAIATATKRGHDLRNAIWDIQKEMTGPGEGPNPYQAAVSKSMATGIMAEAEALKKLDASLSSATARHYAELIKLHDIIDETGGLTSNNLQKWAVQTQRLFEVVARGGELGKKAQDELIVMMGKFADQSEKTGGVWSDQLKTLMSNMKGVGVGVKEITDMIAGQQTKLVKGAVGVTAAMGANADKVLETQKNLKAAQDDIDQAAAEGHVATNEQAAAVLAFQKELQGETKNTQEEFDRLSRISLGAFNTLVASGVTSVEAMRQVGDGIDSLIKGSEAFGFQGNEAFESLKRWRGLVEENGPLLDQLGNLNDLLTASANLGTLTADTFGDMQAQGVSAYDQLIAKGLTQQEAEAQMKPLLENLIQLHKDRGYAIDDETQKIIDQSTEDGILSKQKEDALLVQLDLMAALVTAVGGTLPLSYIAMMKSAELANKKVVESTKKTQESVEGVQAGLEKTDWGGWAKDATDAAGDVQKAVDGVSLGHSPGGIKEMPIKLMESMRSFTEWQKIAVRAAEDVEGAVNDIAPDDQGHAIGEVAAMMNKYDAARMTQEHAGVVMGDITLAIDRPILKDRESIQELAIEVTKNLRKAVGPLGAWTN